MAFILILIGISFCTATALILTNKKVMNDYGFECPTFLTSFHFVLSVILLNLMANMSLIKNPTNVPTIYKWTTGAFGVASIVFMNLNLKVNSIGFYQLSKLCNIPMTVLYKLIFKNKTTPIESLCSLFILLIGLCLFSVNDVEFNLLGLIVAFTAVISTSVFQSRSAYTQSEYNITGPQVNLMVAVPEFVICFFAACFFETTGPKSILNHEFQKVEIGLILLTGVFAVYGNVIGFIMIGKTGPVTFQVIGHTKTILIFIFGLIMFPPKKYESHEKKVKKISGLVISMIGVILYTYFELKIRAKEKKEQQQQNLVVDIDDDEEEQVFTNNQDVLFKNAALDIDDEP